MYPIKKDRLGPQFHGISRFGGIKFTESFYEDDKEIKFTIIRGEVYARDNGIFQMSSMTPGEFKVINQFRDACECENVIYDNINNKFILQSDTDNISLSLNASLRGNVCTFTMGVFKNGVLMPNAVAQQRISTGVDIGMVSINCMDYDPKYGDCYDIRFGCDVANKQFLIVEGNFNVRRII
jgi:hypothetical protein